MLGRMTSALAPRQASLFATGATRTPTGGLGDFEPLDRTSSILYEPGWLRGSDRLFDDLCSRLPWKAMERPMYERIVAVPRLVCSLTVSDLDRADPLAPVTADLSRLLGIEFTHIGANLYRDGRDSVAWHGDKVGRIADSCVIALVSLGSARPFKMRPRPGYLPSPTRTWHLGDGDLFVMAGACQRDWQHCVPKVKQAAPRLSLAFRTTGR